MPKEEPDIQVETPEAETDELSEVVVDTEKKPEQKQEEPKQQEPKVQPDIAKLNNTIAYQTRQLERAMREMAELKAQVAQRPSTVQEKSQPVDEIDEIAQRDWKAGVKKLVDGDLEAKIQEAFDKREKAQQELNRKFTLNQELEKSKQRVISKYPNIEDDTTEESALYRQVINEDTSILSNIHGPEIAMYRMEERMRQMGKTPPSVKPIVDREVSRLARAGASSVIGKQVSPDGKITLTKEQKEFCDHYNIPYEQYAKNLKAGALGGVEI